MEEIKDIFRRYIQEHPLFSDEYRERLIKSLDAYLMPKLEPAVLRRLFGLYGLFGLKEVSR